MTKSLVIFLLTSVFSYADDIECRGKGTYISFIDEGETYEAAIYLGEHSWGDDGYATSNSHECTSSVSDWDDFLVLDCSNNWDDMNLKIDLNTLKAKAKYRFNADFWDKDLEAATDLKCKFVF